METLCAILIENKFAKPTITFLLEALFSILATATKINFRNLARISQFCEHTWSRNYQKEIDFQALFKAIIKRGIPESHSKIFAIDASFIPKSGKHTFGLGRFWCGMHAKAEIGLEISLGAVIDTKTKNAFPLTLKQTSPESNEGETRVDFVVQQLQEMAEHLKSIGCRQVVGDAGYVKKKVVHRIQKMGLHLTSKLRQDAVVKRLCTDGPTGKPGRPRLYSDKLDKQDRELYT